MTSEVRSITGDERYSNHQSSDQSEASPVLTVRDITVRYSNSPTDRPACQSISFDLFPCERMTLLGPTGCGKSTLLKAIAGFLPLSSGQVILCGRQVTKPSQDRFVVFQEFDQLFPWQTIRANVIYAIRAADRRNGHPRRSRTHVRRDADQYLEMVHLEGRGDLYPSECSGGMKQRVALARALAVQPTVLLLDEPFGALDAQTRSRLQELLLEVSRGTDLSMLFVTHDIGEAIYLGHRIMMLSSQGELLALLDSTSSLEDNNEEKAVQEAHLTERLRELLNHRAASPSVETELKSTISSSRKS